MLAYLRTLGSKVSGLFGHRSRLEKDFDAEIREHLLQLEERFVRQGMSREDARSAARRSFGGVEQLKEIRRDHLSFVWLDHFGRDVRFAVRSLSKNLGFSIVALLTLALGIGANTAIFSVINGVVLQPLPYSKGDELILVRQQLPVVGVEQMRFSVHDIEDYRNQNSTFSALVEYHEMSFVLLGQPEPERVQTGVVSWNFFDVLGVKPLLGRGFRSTDEQHDADAVLLLSYDYWQRSFGGDRSIVGRVFEMNDRPHTVIGVLPPVPQFPQENDVYMPTSACPFRSDPPFVANRNARMMGLLGRLKPGVSLEAAQADLNVIAGRLLQQYPGSYSKPGGYRAKGIALKDQLTRDIRPTLWVLLCTAGFVLLIVCASVANLTLARFLRRDREIAVRAAVGASRMQLFRQLLTESTILAIVGGALGLLFAYAGLDVLVAFAAKFTTRAAEIRIDRWVLLFTGIVSVGTGIVFGSMPAFISRRDLASALKEGGTRTSASAGHQRFRNALIAAEVAVAFMLLIGAGLMVRSLMNLEGVDAGFRPQNILTARVDLNFSNYRNDPDKVRRFFHQVLENLRNVPGVTSAAAGSTFPLNTQRPNTLRLKLEGQASGEDESSRPQADVLVASPDYFDTLGIPLLAGRTFSSLDRADSAPVAILNRSMARHYWPDGFAVGRHLSADDGRTWLTVVGVVADSKKTLEMEVADSFFVPLEQNPGVSTIMVRTSGNPAAVGKLVREAVYAVDSQQPVDSLRTVEQIRSDSLSSPRLTMTLLCLFAALALLITAAGIGGVIGFFVNQRRHEIGIRMALGAKRITVLWMVLREGMFIIVIGIVLGVTGAFGLGRLMSGLLFGIRPTDPATFVSVVAVLIGVAASACFVPAHRAASIDPSLALRND
jgi:putative ABC transport system permease protein